MKSCGVISRDRSEMNRYFVEARLDVIKTQFDSSRSEQAVGFTYSIMGLELEYKAGRFSGFEIVIIVIPPAC